MKSPSSSVETSSRGSSEDRRDGPLYEFERRRRLSLYPRDQLELLAEVEPENTLRALAWDVDNGLL